LSFDRQVNFQVEVQSPFGLAEEASLEWYFEDWLRFPMLDTVRANAAAASVRAYGENLFQQIFKTNFDAYAEYSKVRGDLQNWRIEIEGSSPEFQGLHWEALRDRDLPRPLAVDCVMVRKSTAPTAVAAVMLPSPTINLLMVTARPSRNDVGYRTISRPLIEALENSQLRVKVDLLRPATYEALTKHLEEKGAGYYHIIHFDAHGALLKFDEFSKLEGTDAGIHSFKQRYGRSQIAAYEGVKAFVAMEGDEEGVADLVEATELANLLTGKKIPVCILNACQSGKQLGAEAVLAVGQAEDYRETSLGSRLMSAGMQMVVAMGYSVTVTAAKVMMAQVYQDLFRGKGLEEAIRLGRFELLNRKERRAYFNQTIDLEDWLLPVVYGNQTVDFNLWEFSIQKDKTLLLLSAN
jgi:GNAT superfamily N-acetyltransferase